MALTSLLKSSRGAKPLCQEILHSASWKSSAGPWKWLRLVGLDRRGCECDDKKEVGWDAVAGKHPLENQRNSSRLGSHPLSSLLSLWCPPCQVFQGVSTAEHKISCSDVQVRYPLGRATLEQSVQVICANETIAITVSWNLSVCSNFLYTATERNDHEKEKTAFYEFGCVKGEREASQHFAGFRREVQ